MEIKAWETLFAPQILYRGKEYMDARLVTVHKEEENRIEATVEGTYPYCVEISLLNGQVTEMACNCPYAEDGNNCKHMAAVLYSVDDPSGDAQSFSEELIEQMKERRLKEKEALHKAVSALPEAEVRSILLEAATKHRDIQERITLYGKKGVGPSERKKWKADLKMISRRASDRHGFIDYRHAYDYTAELCAYLSEKIGPLMDNRLISDAFELAGLVFVEALDHEMDDSDGGLSVLADRCKSYWKELIPAPEADRKEMLSWFVRIIKHFSGDVGADWLLSVVLTNFRDADLLPSVLDVLDNQIETAHEFTLPGLIKDRIELMERMGKTEEEVDAYRRAYWRLPSVRHQELDRLEAARKWDEALALIRECEELDADEPNLLQKYCLRRIAILKQAGSERAYAEALKAYVFSYPQREISQIVELKQAVPPGDWPELLNMLYSNKNTRNLRHDLLLNEGQHEQLMTELETGTNIHELGKYENALRDIYPDRMLNLLLKIKDQEIQTASCRSAYYQVVSSLKRLYGYPDGRERVKKMARSWRERYPRRSALLDELDQAKL